MKKYLICLLLLSQNAMANDGPWKADHLGQLQFYKEVNISMEKEILNIDLDKKLVSVNYTFKNNSNSNVEVDVGFPLPTCGYSAANNPGSLSDCMDWRDETDALNMILWVNNKKYKDGKWLVILKSGEHQLLLKRKEDWLPYRGNLYCKESEQFKMGEGSCTPVQVQRTEEIVKQLHLDTSKYVEAFENIKIDRIFQWKLSLKKQQVITVKHTYKASLNSAGSSNLKTKESFKAMKNLDAFDWAITTGGSIEGQDKGLDKFCSQKNKVLIADRVNNMKEGEQLPFSSFEYVLRTGSMWKGPIQDFTLNIIGPKGKILTTCFPGLTKTGMNQFTSHLINYEPKGDLLIGILGEPYSYHPDAP